jgi:hypothetical protein
LVSPYLRRNSQRDGTAEPRQSFYAARAATHKNSIEWFAKAIPLQLIVAAEGGHTKRATHPTSFIRPLFVGAEKEASHDERALNPRVVLARAGRNHRFKEQISWEIYDSHRVI